jgi:hypothetical protein
MSKGSKMSKTFRRWAILFVLVQVIGLASMCFWPFAKAAGPFLWGTAFIALLPGNLLSAMLIEKLFWNVGISLKAMSITEIPLMIAFNGALWFVVIGSIRWLFGRRSH